MLDNTFQIAKTWQIVFSLIDDILYAIFKKLNWI